MGFIIILVFWVFCIYVNINANYKIHSSEKSGISGNFDYLFRVTQRKNFSDKKSLPCKHNCFQLLLVFFYVNFT